MTVDTKVQAERFKFLKVEDQSMAIGLMDPYLQQNINTDVDS